MPCDGPGRSKRNRRSFLKTTTALGVLGVLAGCNAGAEEPAQTTQSNDDTNENSGSFESLGGQWLTFGENDNWGIRYNRSTNEFEVVSNPFGKNSRRNIRIEVDENGDKGDIYIDDSLIVKNEVEVSDGSVVDPAYTFANRNDVGFWREDGGVLGVTTAGSSAMQFDNGDTRVDGHITTAKSSPVSNGPPTVIWNSEAEHSPNLPASTAVRSGDGSTTTFSLPHELGSAPKVATVSPTSRDAAGQFWVSDKTAEAVEVTYASPPAPGTDNLAFDIVVSL